MVTESYYFPTVPSVALPIRQAIAGLRRQLLGTLGELGLVDVHRGMDEANSRSNDPEFVRAALLAGLFPGVASAVANSRSNEPEFVRAALRCWLDSSLQVLLRRLKRTVPSRCCCCGERGSKGVYRVCECMRACDCFIC
ncbi:unnamed protein product [Closterium sp. Yama58-4]|nr:unnamed protein product [Closterium sp. Yama58-4]